MVKKRQFWVVIKLANKRQFGVVISWLKRGRSG